MLLLSLDFETSGLDRNSDRVIEVGAVLYSTAQDRSLMTQGFLVDNEIPVSAEITELTSIKKGMIDKFGVSSKTGLSMLLNMIDLSEAIVGQGIARFDLFFLKNWALREKEEVPARLVIDTETDLPGVQSKKLSYMAADAGFLNPFPHQAVADCMTVLRLISDFNIDDVVVRAKSPIVTLGANVSFDNNQQAKKRGYRWEPGRKVWYKVMKELDVEREAKEAPFDVSRIEPIDMYTDSMVRLESQVSGA